MFHEMACSLDVHVEAIRSAPPDFFSHAWIVGLELAAYATPPIPNATTVNAPRMTARRLDPELMFPSPHVKAPPAPLRR